MLEGDGPSGLGSSSRAPISPHPGCRVSKGAVPDWLRKEVTHAKGGTSHHPRPGAAMLRTRCFSPAPLLWVGRGGIIGVFRTATVRELGAFLWKGRLLCAALGKCGLGDLLGMHVKTHFGHPKLKSDSGDRLYFNKASWSL